MNLFELLKSLIDIPSVSGQEKAIADFLVDYLRESGWNVQEQTIEKGRRNLLAVRNKKPKVILCTHMDTVPPHFPAEENEEAIYGRGACDAKGSLAAMIKAAEKLIELNASSLGLLFLAGEESDSIGAKAANAMEIGSDYIIVGEPTDNKMAVGHKGFVMLRLTCLGKSAHSAFPQQGESAIEKLLDVLEDLRSLDLGRNAVLGKASLNIGTIEGGKAANIVPDHASAEVAVRCVVETGRSVSKIRSAVGARADIEVVSRSDPQKMLAVPGFDQTVVPFSTDIPHLKKFGRPLLIGPGLGLHAHTEREKVGKFQLTEAVRIYTKLVRFLQSRND